MNFDQFSLDPRLNAGIRVARYTTPTPIQEQAIPIVLEGRDVLGIAQTGTGKTAAFVLPILQRLTKGKLRKVRALIVSPTRELAEQTHQVIRVLGKKTKIRSVTIYGGVNKNRQIEALRRGAEIIVACPGRLLDIVSDGHLDLSQVEVLVLDEADRMFDMGFLPDVRRIIKLIPQERQSLFFSATMPEDIRKLADNVLVNPATIQIGMIAPAKSVSHALYPIPFKKKKSLLFQMLKTTATGRVLIFTRTKRRARYLASDLAKRKYRVSALQGNMSQNARQRAIDGFKNGKFDILVATDVASRGIDVSDISHVINFDMPDTIDAYTHRIGRTGRVDQVGDAFTFASPEDSQMVREIEKALKTRIERRRYPEFDYEGFKPENQFPGQNANRSQKRSSHRQKGSQNTQTQRNKGSYKKAKHT